MSRFSFAAILVIAGAHLTLGCGSGPEPTPEPELSGAALWTAQVVEAQKEASRAPGIAYWPYRLGELYLEVDSLEHSEAHLREALRLQPDFAPALTLLSKLYYDSGRSNEAIPLLEAAWSSPELSDEARLGLALHYEKTGRAEDARRILEEIPRNEASVSGVSYLYLSADEPGAAAAAEAAVAADPGSAIGRNNLGVVRLRAGDPGGARRELVAAMELDPFLPGPLYNLALLDHHFFIDDTSAKRWFARYWELSQDDPDSLRGVLFPDGTVPSPFGRSE